MAWRVAIYHNILWAKYKGLVFSNVYSQSKEKNINASFVQVAETEKMRIGLSNVDLSYHNYPYRLLFRGSYEEISGVRRAAALALDIIRNRSDLVVLPGYHLFEYWTMLAVCIVLRRKRAVFCDSTAHDQPQFFLKELAKRLFFRRCDGFFCYGLRSKQYVMHYGVKEAKVNFRCQAAALPHDYNPNSVLDQYRDGCLDFVSAPRFLFVGRLSTEKGLGDMFDALRAVRARSPGARLDIIGAGPLRDTLVTQIKDLGLEGVVTLHGTMDLAGIAASFMRSTALVLPSHSEPWGLVVNESLSYGCPVVVSKNCGCVPELVIDGVTGFSFETGDIGGLSTAMLAALELSRDRVKTAQNCLRIIAEFTPERAAAQILEGCERILNSA